MQLRERLHQVRMQAKTLRRAVADLEAEAHNTLERLGLPQKKKQEAEPEVIDLGKRPSRVVKVLKRGAQAVLVGASFAVLGAALLSLGMFAAAAALAFFMITKGLGVRIDVAGARPATS